MPRRLELGGKSPALLAELASRIVTCAVNGGPTSGGGELVGGRKESGIGSERSIEGLDIFLATKSVAMPAVYVPASTDVPAGN